MSRLEFLFSKSLPGYLWQEFQVRYRFKYVLPKVTQTVQDGIRLDLSRLSLKVRNRILMGIYEANEQRLCEEFLTADDAVLEIGAAIGFIGLVCQKRIGIQNYFAFEANPETIEILKTNYRLNGLAAAAWNVALGPGEGTLELEVASDFWENSVVAANNGSASQKVRVPSASLSSLVRTISRKINVLIIDVEGAEQFIDPDEIPAEINKIIIELHPKLLGSEKTYDLIAGLIQRGYYVAREESATFAFLKRSKQASAFTRPRWDLQEYGPAFAAGTEQRT